MKGRAAGLGDTSRGLCVAPSRLKLPADRTPHSLSETHVNVCSTHIQVKSDQDASEDCFQVHFASLHVVGEMHRGIDCDLLACDVQEPRSK